MTSNRNNEQDVINRYFEYVNKEANLLKAELNQLLLAYSKRKPEKKSGRGDRKSEASMVTNTSGTRTSVLSAKKKFPASYSGDSVNANNTIYDQIQNNRIHQLLRKWDKTYVCK